MSDFDELFVQKISTSRATQWLSQGMGRTLAYAATNPTGEQEVRVLNLLGFVFPGHPGQFSSRANQ